MNVRLLHAAVRSTVLGVNPSLDGLRLSERAALDTFRRRARQAGGAQRLAAPSGTAVWTAKASGVRPSAQ